MQSLTLLTCRSTSLIDHISANFPSRVSQHDVINLGVSDYLLSFRWFNNYTVDVYNDFLKKVNFFNWRLGFFKFFFFQQMRAVIAIITQLIEISIALLIKLFCNWPTVQKLAKYGNISGPYFPAFGLNKYLSIFSSNAGKYGPEITPYFDTFHAVTAFWFVIARC